MHPAAKPKASQAYAAAIEPQLHPCTSMTQTQLTRTSTSHRVQTMHPWAGQQRNPKPQKYTLLPLLTQLYNAVTPSHGASIQQLTKPNSMHVACCIVVL
jgi:hypothetical protein